MRCVVLNSKQHLKHPQDNNGLLWSFCIERRITVNEITHFDKNHTDLNETNRSTNTQPATEVSSWFWSTFARIMKFGPMLMLYLNSLTQLTTKKAFFSLFIRLQILQTCTTDIDRFLFKYRLLSNAVIPCIYAPLGLDITGKKNLCLIFIELNFSRMLLVLDHT